MRLSERKALGYGNAVCFSTAILVIIFVVYCRIVTFLDIMATSAVGSEAERYDSRRGQVWTACMRKRKRLNSFYCVDGLLRQKTRHEGTALVRRAEAEGGGDVEGGVAFELIAVRLDAKPD